MRVRGGHGCTFPAHERLVAGQASIIRRMLTSSHVHGGDAALRILVEIATSLPRTDPFTLLCQVGSKWGGAQVVILVPDCAETWL